jgi:hypothetical protein
MHVWSQLHQVEEIWSLKNWPFADPCRPLRFSSNSTWKNQLQLGNFGSKMAKLTRETLKNCMKHESKHSYRNKYPPHSLSNLMKFDLFLTCRNSMSFRTLSIPFLCNYNRYFKDIALNKLALLHSTFVQNNSLPAFMVLKINQQNDSGWMQFSYMY